MKSEYHICIVIPCYNEENRLPLDEYRSFIEKTPNALLCFVNDGSIDHTLQALEELKGNIPGERRGHFLCRQCRKSRSCAKGNTALQCQLSLSHYCLFGRRLSHITARMFETRTKCKWTN